MITSLSGKHCVVQGVATDSSICWGIAQAIQEWEGVPILLSHPMTRKHVEKLASSNGMPAPLFADVGKPDELDAALQEIGRRYSKVHGYVHGVAFCQKSELRGAYLDGEAKNFAEAMMISCYSLTDMLRRLEPLMADGASAVTLTFEASHLYYPHYNAMSLVKAAQCASIKPLSVELGRRRIRVNGIDASPEETTAARTIGDFRRIGDFAEAMVPERRRATLREIGNATAFLLSSMSSAITGHVLPVDCGLHMIKMPPPWNAGHMAHAMTLIDNRVKELKAKGAGS